MCGGGVIGIIGGTPDKRISEGLLSRFFFCGWGWGFYRQYGGTSDKRIFGGLF